MVSRICSTFCAAAVSEATVANAVKIKSRKPVTI